MNLRDLAASVNRQDGSGVPVVDIVNPCFESRGMGWI